MNQQQLDAIKARVEAAHADNGPTNLDKVKAVALFRHHAIYDVLALVAEVERLRAIERQVRHYLSSDGDTYQAYLKLCEVCGIPPEEPEETDEYVSKLEAENRQLKADINRMVY
jgi:hypothetical protein